ncbi:MAG: phosphotransferase family protein [Candidatus Hodarchaeales archaeon]|jgi:aminoglycoside phosphotransferase (APT) family kinase protein
MTLEEIRVKLADFYEKRTDFSADSGILDLNKISSGWETEVYSFDIKNEKQRENLILRTFPGTGGKEKADYEFGLMKNLAANEYPVPRAFYLMSDEKILGCPFIIMERLTGGTLWEAMKEGVDVEKQRLWSLFTRCFVNLHELNWTDVVPNPSRFEFRNLYEHIEEPLQHERRVVTDYKLEEFLEVVEWLEERLNTVPGERLSLVHYDYHPENVVLSAEKKPFVIDWSVSRVTDYRVDLGWTLLCESTYGPRELRDIILNEYQHFSKSRVHDIEFFEVVAALRRLRVIAISLTGQDDVVGSRPEVDAILEGDTKHVDGVIEILKDRTGITMNGFESLVRKASTSTIR